MNTEQNPNMKILTALLALGLGTTLVQASTTVSGVVAGETWTSDGSPYLVVGDVVVAQLSIQPGVEIRFQGEYELQVAGSLNAEGTAESPIWFHPVSDRTWKGIFFNQSGLASSMAYCTIQGSTNSGIRISDTALTARQCRVINNSSAGWGGGIVVNGSQQVSFEDCNISGNSASGSGGGLQIGDGTVVVMSHCLVSSNSASAATSTGGGLRFSGQQLTMNNCVIVGNSVSGSWDVRGGGLYTWGNASINNCVFAYNSARSLDSQIWAFGGGIVVGDPAVVVARNSLIASNSVLSDIGVRGGGVYLAEVDAGHTFTAVNCTIAYNSTSGIDCATGSANVRNSILWKNGSPQITGAGTVSVNYSDVDGGFSGTGNVSFNPIFLPGTLSLIAGSPCIDAGDPASIYNDVCFPPSQGGARNDMGAYGGSGACNWPVAGVPSIVTPPASKSVAQGSNVTFTVVASGTEPLGYQWRCYGTNLPNGGRFSGAASPTLSIASAQTSDAGPYSVVVSNWAGMVTSSPPATLTVAVLPSITGLTMQPASPIVEGTNVTFCVTAGGTAPLAYQWRRNGAEVSGATVNCYTITNVQVGHAGTYSVAVSNAAGGLVSSDLALAVLPDWRTNVVGATGDGDYSIAGGVFTVNGSGEDIEGTKDDFFFVHKPLNGDGQIVARLLVLLPADPNSEAGVMLRDGTNSGARHVFLPLDEGKHVSFRRRLVENDYAVETGHSGTNWTWLRLMRLGDTFVGHASTNGTDWSLVWWTTVLNMPTNLEAGLAVTAHKNGAMATAQFDNVSTGPLTPLPGVWPEAGPRIYLGGEADTKGEFVWVGGFKALIGGVVGERYAVKASADVAAPFASWLDLGTVTNTYGVVPFTDPQALTNGIRFYRATVVTP